MAPERQERAEATPPAGKPTRRRTLWRAARISLAGVPVVSFCLFFWGNPQWHKYIFMFQTHYLKRYLPVPDDYTGVWREWHPNGHLASEEHYENGLRHGHQTFYNSKGNVIGRYSYTNGLRHGNWFEWDGSGGTIMESEYRDGKPWNGLCYVYEAPASSMLVYRKGRRWLGCLHADDKTKGSSHLLCYIEGKQVSREVFLRRCVLSPDVIQYDQLVESVLTLPDFLLEDLWARTAKARYGTRFKSSQ